MSRIDTQPPLNLALVAALFPAGDRREVRDTATQAAQTVRAGSGLESDKQLAYAIIQMASQAAAADVEMTLQEALDKVLKQEESKHARADEQRALLLAGGALQQATGAHTTQFASTPVTEGPAADVVANAPVVAAPVAEGTEPTPEKLAAQAAERLARLEKRAKALVESTDVANEVEEPAVAEDESMEPSVDAMIAFGDDFGGASEADQVAARINEAVKRAEDQAREMAAADAEIKRLEESIAAIEAGAPFIEVESVPPVEDSGTLPSWLIRTAHAPELPEAAIPVESHEASDTSGVKKNTPAIEPAPTEAAAPETLTPATLEPVEPSTPVEKAPATSAAPAPEDAAPEPVVSETPDPVTQEAATESEAPLVAESPEIAAPTAALSAPRPTDPFADAAVVPAARPEPKEVVAASAPDASITESVEFTAEQAAALEEVAEHIARDGKLSGSFLVAVDGDGWFSKPTISLVTAGSDGTLQVIANPTAAQAKGASLDDSAQSFLSAEFDRATRAGETTAELSMGDNIQVNAEWTGGFAWSSEKNMSYELSGPA